MEDLYERIQAEARRSGQVISAALATPQRQRLIRLDGRYYNAAITSLKRTHNITDGENAGRTMPPRARMIRNVIGTFITYTATFEVKNNDVEEFDDMILTLSKPVDYIPVLMPYGQGWLSYEAYIAKVDDELLSNIGGVRRWGNCTVTFTPMEAQYRP
jgi:hypothetical protein